MRRFLTLYLLLVSAVVFAGERTVDEMKNIARMKLAEISTVSNARGTYAMDVIEVFQNKDGIAVLGKRGAGFVVLAVDDSHSAVLGYSDSDYNAAIANPALHAWLESASKALASDMVKESAVPEGYPAEVKPFITTTWNQSSPYNDKCPSYVSGGKEVHYPTGCVATAMAQAMNFYKWPAVGTGKKKFHFNPQDGRGPQIVSVDLAEMPFDWDNMLDNFTSSASDAQKNAVSTLMFACGTSVEMEYTASGSGAYLHDACVAFRTNFAYNPNLPFYYYEAMSTGEAMSIACSHLTQQHPLVMSAYNPSSGGHAYVIDGYDTDGLMHINWGWGPQGGNGFFSIFTMNGFSESKQMVPLYRGETEYTSIWGFEDGGIVVAKRDDTHISFATEGRPLQMDAVPYVGSLYVVATTKDYPYETVQLAKQDLSTASVGPFYYGTASAINKGNITILNKGVKDGIYRVYLASKGESEKDYRPVRSRDGYTNSYTMEVKDMKITAVTPDTDNAWMAVPTAIGSVHADKDRVSSQRSYNLVGQCIDADTYKGVVIRNGKKFIQK